MGYKNRQIFVGKNIICYFAYNLSGGVKFNILG